ncbi:LacI family transcriptional regulator, partial [Rhizobium leguminosarum]
LALGVATTAAVGAKAQAPTIIAVTHGHASDPFWSIVKNGMMQAATDSNVKVDYRAPETFAMVAMAQLIAAAVNQSPAG